MGHVTGTRAEGAASAATGPQRAGLGVDDLDVLVNDAGVGVWGRFLEVPLSEHLRVLSVNLVSLTTLSHRLAPALVRRRGRMLNLAATASFQPGPNMAVYYATKAYVLSLSLSLAEELELLGVRVTTLCPGGKERMRRLMEMVAHGRVDLTPLLTHHFALTDIDEALDLFSHQRDGVLKVVLHPGGLPARSETADVAAQQV